MEIVDLRSDTVTKPTTAMREAMAKAEVGDDVFGEDPTINHLQELAADMMGKEAGLFVPSGTMGNLTAVLTHCGRGDEVIMGDLAHTFLFEVGGISALGGVFPHTLPNQPDGTLDLETVKGSVRSDDIHFPSSRLLLLENTHNRCGGVPIRVDYMKQAGKVAKEAGLKLHLDGARIFNAAAALDVSARRLAEDADSVTFCLSKALCAPVGSVLCGSKEFIGRARRIRKQLGGGMRQAGILAAAGIVALETMVERLPEDHAHARNLVEGLSANKGLVLDSGTGQTNMVFANLADRIKISAKEVAGRLNEAGVKVGVVGPRRFRMVTHYWVDLKGIDQTIEGFAKAF
ncbi:MAG: low-specificity L-threonine aldolase [Anaerolineaceae bacterium]